MSSYRAAVDAVTFAIYEQGRPTAELVREAVAEYADRHGGRQRPRSIGAVRSGLGDLSERAEERLSGFGEE